MKLHEVNGPGTYRIRSIHLSGHDASELDRLGLVPGTVVEVLHNDFRGTLGIRFRGDLIILGRSESFHIQVVEVAGAGMRKDR